MMAGTQQPLLDELTLSVVGEVKPSRRAALSWSRSKQPCINRHRADVIPCMLRARSQLRLQVSEQQRTNGTFGTVAQHPCNLLNTFFQARPRTSLSNISSVISDAVNLRLPTGSTGLFSF